MFDSALNSHSAAKFIRPRLAHTIPRERSYAEFDRAMDRPLIWLDAAAGAGKTSLASAYVEARRRPYLWFRCERRDADPAETFKHLCEGLATLCRISLSDLPPPTPGALLSITDYVQRLFQRVVPHIPERTLFVFDDFHLPQDAAHLNILLECGLTLLPPGCNALLLSRESPPPELALLRSRELATVIASDCLRFDRGELQTIMELHGHSHSSPQTLDKLQQMTQGWAAGVTLLLENPDVLITPYTTETLFDYFSTQVVHQLPHETFLLVFMLSMLPEITPGALNQLQTDTDGSSLLKSLWRSNVFVTRRLNSEVYDMHPLFRDFLSHYARQTLEPGSLHGLQTRVAAYLNEAGQGEQAVELLLEYGHFNELVELLQQVCPLALQQGKMPQVQRWLKALPEPYRSSHASFDCWDGLCQVTLSPRKARELLQQAYTAFADANNQHDAIIAVTGIIESIVNQGGNFHELDEWLPKLSRLLDESDALPETQLTRCYIAMFSAMMYRIQPSSIMSELASRLQQIINHCQDDLLQASAKSQLLFYQTWWRGNRASASIIAAQAPKISIEQSSAAVRILWSVILTVFLAIPEGDTQSALLMVDKGLSLADQSGIHIWDNLLIAHAAWCHLTTGDIDRALQQITRMGSQLIPGRMFDLSHYHCLMSIVCLHRRDTVTGMQHCQHLLRCTREAGLKWAEVLALCIISRFHLLESKHNKALSVFAEAEALAQDMDGDMITFHLLYNRVQLSRHLPEFDTALTALFKLWRKCDIRNFDWWHEPEIADLCAEALDRDIEPEFVCELISQRDISAPTHRPLAKEWPVPVYIKTIGVFNIKRRQEMLHFKGKIPKKPLSLLKVLIAFGGKASETQLIDMLWPDLDGDAGQRSLTVNLHRLRGLIGRNSVVYSSKLLQLNERDCRVDFLDLEHEVEKFTRAEDPSHVWPMLQEYIQMFATGPFHGDEHEVWAISATTRLRRGLQRLVHVITSGLEQQQKWDEVIECCISGITLDLHDAISHANLIRAYFKLGMPVAAHAAYRRSKEILPGVFPHSLDPELRQMLD